MNNKILTLMSQENSLGFEHTVNLSLTLDADSWLRSQIKIICMIYSIVSNKCGSEIGWDCSINRLLTMVDISCSKKELEYFLSEAFERDYLPDYDIIFYEPTARVFFLNKLMPERQQYFTKYLMSACKPTKNQRQEEMSQ